MTENLDAKIVLSSAGPKIFVWSKKLSGSSKKLSGSSKKLSGSSKKLSGSSKCMHKQTPAR